MEPNALPLDITACDREPIHIPGSIQPYGMLFVLDAQSGRVAQASANVAERLACPVEEIIGRTMEELVTPIPPSSLNEVLIDLGGGSAPGRMKAAGTMYEYTAHITDGRVVLELEPEIIDEGDSLMYHDVRAAIEEIRDSANLRQLADAMAHWVRRIAGFDRAMVYRFLHDGTGHVIAEARDEGVDSFMGLHYPASDIPKQARALYVRNPLRLIHDVSYTPSPILPATNPPLDMSRCFLRSVSPIHVQYLKNMGVGASMSVSLVRDGELWGLIACHHGTPWQGSHRMRTALELIGQVGSLQIGEIEGRTAASFRQWTRQIKDRLVTHMRERGSIAEGLGEQATSLLDLVHATGAAIVQNGRITLFGATPKEEAVRRLIEWLGEEEATFHTENLAERFPEAESYAAVASGLLAIGYSRREHDYVLWFRPEFLQTVTWAGNPHKPTEADSLHPRTSFAEWQETKRGFSRPWTAEEIGAAEDLRVSILEVEVRALNADLERRVEERTQELQKAVDELNGFTYSVSHDLRTPLRGMIGHSRILIEEHGPELPSDARQSLMKIEAAALKMGALVEDLLQFARLGRQEVQRSGVDLSELAEEVGSRLQNLGWPCSGLDLSVQPGMRAEGDPRYLEILFTTLIDNGCKYSQRDQTPKISIRAARENGETVYSVENEGIGFDMQYLHKLFQPFQRLHRDEDYPGTGIGLANAKRIVERHGGRLWAEGRPGDGATFFFTLG